MTGHGPDACLEGILALGGDDRWRIDRAHVVRNVTAYCVRSFDNNALIFAIPVLVSRPFLSEISLGPRGASGAVASIIEHIKKKARTEAGLGPLTGRNTHSPGLFAAFTEPFTIVTSPSALASDIWHAGDRNFADPAGVHLLLNGAVPCPATFSQQEVASVTEAVAHMCDTVAGIVFAVPVPELVRAWTSALDQRMLRDRLPELGLVAFIGDGTRLARCHTRYRCFYRTAGPDERVNIPFVCPDDLMPCELELPASNRTVTGLGIRKKEVFAVAGSNAQGKTTFLKGIMAGVDDHAEGDGREVLVTVHGLCTAEAMNSMLTGADVSMFFSALPPGISGTPRAASGMGSGSLNMAYQVQRAVERHSPLLIIDEDRAAPNLLVRSCLQSGEVTPLSEILCHHREKMGDTALIFAACAMDTLVAQADRIMILDRHVAYAVDRGEFLDRMATSLQKIAGDLRDIGS